MTDAKNALAELAERLRRYADFDIDDANYPDLDKTQRIIEKLASRYEPCFPAKSGDDVIDECRAIAEKARFAMASREYTAQEMRDVAEGLVDSCVADNISILVGHGNLNVVKGDQIVAMLRQAADAEEENAQLKARLEAVVKACARRMKEYDCGSCDFTDEPPWTFERCEIKGCPTRLHAMEFLSILRAARGEGGAE